MEYHHLAHFKHRISLTEEEIACLRDRLVPIAPSNYDLHTFTILRNLYGRFDHIIIDRELRTFQNRAG